MNATVHLKNGVKLRFKSEAADPKDWWRRALASDDGAVSFGHFVVPKRQISHVEFFG